MIWSIKKCLEGMDIQMNILYSSSDSYAFLTGISMLSLLDNNQTCEEIRIFIMDNAITDENKKKLLEVAERYHRELSFVPMPDMKKKTGLDIKTGRWNISTFGRLYMAEVLPNDVEKVLNIDCDTIIVDSLEPLWNIKMDDHIVGGMLESINDRYRFNVGMNAGESFLNGGILMMNLKRVREEKYEDKFTAFIKKYSAHLGYLDQDVINGTVKEKDKVVLPIRYNMLSIYFYSHYKQTLGYRRADSFYSQEEFEYAKKNPGLVHFTTCFLDGLRPWIEGNRHPWRNEFLRYKNMSPWAEQALSNDKRKAFDKFKTLIVKKCPRFILIPIVSVMHGVIVPEKNKKMMQQGLELAKVSESKGE